jgi:hypothetical protein
MASPTPWLLVTHVLLLLAALVIPGSCMTDDQTSLLRKDTLDLFFHGYGNYLLHAFPEDELKPLSCGPQTRNREDPGDIGLNDVLGNYSLTLVDSLSTLAILAGGEEEGNDGRSALDSFQDGVQKLVQLYGDGYAGSCGSRACGFDLDSKVQVFETNIRGVGGLLSAHLFAVGELPIRGYEAIWEVQEDGREGIRWGKTFVYDGQLLRLALDLATRLLPAFGTDTGLPYPRVNLRNGVPFYRSSSVEDEPVCRLDGSSSDHSREITETCTAGAGSLVLEFTTLSRLTGDMRFEKLAKKAFWAIWNKRSNIGLLGNGIDAETGQWTIPPLAGIGAGVDSFFEYAFKSYVLLSSLPPSEHHSDNPESFLNVWTQSHAAVRHHIHRSQSTLHPFYGQSDFMTGAPRYTWIDNLSAYYPGLLVLAGELDEAIEAHLLFSALWTRYSALPERWHLPPTTATPISAPGGYIDPHFRHWAGRPEFIESTYYLYQATRDPYYLHVGEMALRDIRRRCWARCGWADLGDVVSGEKRDRMESFFLGETAKYLYLLFTEDHPLNKGRGGEGVVFTTEGHPLVIPKSARRQAGSSATKPRYRPIEEKLTSPPPQCPIPPQSLALTISNVANRRDLFHAAALAHLHLVPVNPTRSSPLVEPSQHGPGISLADVRSPTNYTFYPWTLPQDLIPKNGMTSVVWTPVISTLTFPDLSAMNTGADSDDGTSSGKSGAPTIALGALQKVLDGILIHSLSNVRLSMVQEPRSLLLPADEDGGTMVEMEIGREFRVQGIANWMLGRDEKVIITGKALEGVSPTDPHFTRKRDLERVDLVLDLPAIQDHESREGDEVLDVEIDAKAPETYLLKHKTLKEIREAIGEKVRDFLQESALNISRPGDPKYDSWLKALSSKSTKTPSPTSSEAPGSTLSRTLIPAILPTGVGAAPIPPTLEATDPTSLSLGSLPLKTLFFLQSTLCTHQLPADIAKTYQILVIQRGGCSFNEKLDNIPTIPASSSEGLQLVIVVDDHNDSDASNAQLIRPLLDSVQKTPSGLERRHPIAMVMVDGREETKKSLRRLASAFGVGFEEGQARIIDLVNREDPKSETPTSGTGMAMKRRYWFESMGVPIANLIVL